MACSETLATGLGVLDEAIDEDAGGDTQQRYRWQHHCTAADVMQMLRDPKVVRVVCEIHTDYVVERTDGYELVSCKHREQNRGPWKLNELCSSALGRLFDRWLATGRPACRLMTNAALSGGKSEAEDVLGDASVKDGACVDRLVQALLHAGRATPGRKPRFPAIPDTAKPPRGKPADVPPDFREKVEAFLGSLRIRSELPSREHVQAVYVDKIARVILGETGMDSVDANATYTNVVGLVADRNQRKELRGDYANWLVDPKQGAARGSQQALVSARTITVADVRDQIVSHSVGPLRRHAVGPQERLRAKLRAGGSEPTEATAACRLQEAWQAERARFRLGLPGDNHLQDHLETSILTLAARATIEAREAHSDKWAGSIWKTVQDAIKEGAIPEAARVGLRPEHLLGLMFDLSAQCEIWFSPEFDVDAVIAAMEAEA